MSRFFRNTVALALLAHLFMVFAMAVSPRLHEAVHHDADEHEHECAVTLFIHGAADDAAPTPALTAVELVCVELVQMEASQEVFLAWAEGRIRERAPPSAAV